MTHLQRPPEGMASAKAGKSSALSSSVGGTGMRAGVGAAGPGGLMGQGMRVSSILKVFGSTGKSEAGQWHELAAY